MIESRSNRPAPFAPAPHGGPSPHYLFFGGKGGTGKTTCAAAAAVALAERGRRLLVVSTDPAHSLGDVLGRRLTARPTTIPVRRGHLHGCELDADRALGRWLAHRRQELATIFQRGTILDRADIEDFLDLSLPGVDELLGILEIERLAAGNAYDQVVIDTAPTGHTLRLLATPALFETVARVLDVLQEKHRVLAAAFQQEAGGDGSEEIIEEIRRDGERLGALLRDRSRTRLCWVTLPEELSVAESNRAMASLEADGIHAGDVIVNRVTPPPPSACLLCDGRRQAEAEWLRAMSAQWPDRNVRLWTLAAREEPPQRLAGLRALARSLVPLDRRVRQRRTRRPATRTATVPRGEALPTPLRASRSTRVMIVGGKGGVGKTTCAAALALAVARDAPDRRVLLVSTDPAHSIGDVLGQSIGDAERRIRQGPPNLAAREIDAAGDWRARRERYRESVAHLFDRLSDASAADLTVDRASTQELIELAPPGMDELVGILVMIDTLTPGGERAISARNAQTPARVDLVIVDSAPTGHTLRLLALPGQAHAWVRQLIAVVLKYRLVAGAGQLARELVWLSRGLRRLQALLTNPRACGFIVVTRPEELPGLETLRLIEWLQRQRIQRRALIVNGITRPGCARCRRAAARERRQIAALTRRPVWKRSGGAIVLAEAIAPPPRGVAALSGWAGTWRDRSNDDIRRSTPAPASRESASRRTTGRRRVEGLAIKGED